MLGILESVGLKCSTTEIPIPTPFCKHHYYLVYKTKVPFQANCVTFNASLKKAQWILSILTVLLQHHLAISCKVRKYGTLLYRPNVDFNTLLAQNLWEKRNHSKKITCTSCANSNSDPFVVRERTTHT